MANGVGDRRQEAEGLAAQEAPGEPARESGARPAARFYVPLPLGSEAYVTPLAPTQSEPPHPAVRVFGLILGSAAALAFLALGAAFWFKSASTPAAMRETSTSRSAISVTERATPALPGAVPAEETRQATAEERTPKISAAAPTTAPASPAATATPEPELAAAVIARTTPAEARPKAAAEPVGARTKTTHHAVAVRSSNAALERPDRAQVLAAMLAVQPAVRECFGPSRDTATANLKILGRTGRVTTAQVTGLQGSIGSCLARAVRQARFPKFAAESLTISYPLHR